MLQDLNSYEDLRQRTKDAAAALLHQQLARRRKHTVAGQDAEDFLIAWARDIPYELSDEKELTPEFVAALILARPELLDAADDGLRTARSAIMESVSKLIYNDNLRDLLEVTKQYGAVDFDAAERPWTNEGEAEEKPATRL